MEAWSVNQVCRWLVEKNLGELVHRFQEEEVSGAALLALNDRMVQQLVKKIGHQAVLMDLIKKYKQKSQGLKSPGSSGETAQVKQAAAAPEQWEGKKLFQIQLKEFLAFLDGLGFELEVLLSGLESRYGRAKSPCSYMAAWVRVAPISLALSRNTYITLLKHGPSSLDTQEFPYDVRCVLAERKRPDHSVRIRIVECLQADMTKYLRGSLYPTTQQYNDVVNTLLQAHPFLDEDGCGFFLWKRALKDRFKYVRRPIEDDEQVMRNKCKFGHRRGQKRNSLADIRFDEIKIVQIKEEGICLDSEIDEHISWFQHEYVKTERDWREIDKRMSQTLQIRRKLIGSRTPVKDILKMFPFLKCPYQMFREFQVLTRTDICKKTRHILESYSENILTSFPVADNPISIALQEKMKQHSDEDTLKHMKMTATCLVLPDVFGDDPSLFVIVNEKVQVSTPVLEVKNPFDIDVCEFSLYVEKERLTKVDDCVTALAALVAAFHVFGIQCPRRLSQTLNFLETLIFDMHSPYFPSMKEKEKEVGFQLSVT